jgi:glycosyltransferase involved in cell wall biosynthesis
LKVLIDALGATEYSGGMMLHASEIINTWGENFPDDELVVVGGSALFRKIIATPRLREIHYPNESFLTRAPGQLFVTPLLAWRFKVDEIVSLSPIVSRSIRTKKTICFQHDWRHIRHPDEFSRLQRIYRYLWRISARHARWNVCISEKTAIETVSLESRANVIVIPNGRDHARRWAPRQTDTPATDIAITFGHHINKRPELVIKAWALLPPNTTTKLKVLGARGDYATHLQRLIDSLQMHEKIDLVGFVSDLEYQNLVSSSRCLILASSDEGFGLPIAEAEYLHIPAVITSDIGVVDLFPNALVAAPSPKDLSEKIGLALNNPPHRKTDAWTWLDMVTAIRKL